MRDKILYEFFVISLSSGSFACIELSAPFSHYACNLIGLLSFMHVRVQLSESEGGEKMDEDQFRELMRILNQILSELQSINTNTM